MSVFSKYLCRLFFVRFAATLFVVMSFALLFDLLDVFENLVGDIRYGSLGAIALYMALKLPVLMTEVFPITVLLTILMMMGALSQQSEVVAIWATGVSQQKMIGYMMPAALLLCVFKFVLDDQITTRSLEQLRNWGVGGISVTRGSSNGTDVWLKSNNLVVRLPVPDTQRTDRRSAMLVLLDADGRLVERKSAQDVDFFEDRWVFYNISSWKSGAQALSYEDIMQLEPIIPLNKLRLLSKAPQELTSLELFDLIVADGFQTVPTERYVTWLVQRFVSALLPMLLIILAIILCNRVDRRASMARYYIYGIGIGFCFIIFNGLSAAVGEAGIFSPVAASVAPAIAFLLFLALLYRLLCQRVPR